jgi:Rap1a immunity proteins
MRMQGLALSLLCVALVGALPPEGAFAQATNPDDFHVRTTEDLVALCSAEPTDPNYVAAIHFCHGFGTGAYQYYESIASEDPSALFVCPPDPRPTRGEAIAGFVAWAHANPQFMKDRPVDSLFRYLSTAYPCPK